jgi:hypothetical protein
MSWHRLATNPEVIEKLYGDLPPMLEGCWFASVHLDECQGGSMSVGLSIKQMPEANKWPKEWWNESNRVHVGLSFSGLSAVHIDGWSFNAIASVDLRRADDGRSVAVKLSGTWGYVTATSDSMTIRLSAGKSVKGPENPYDL